MREALFAIGCILALTAPARAQIPVTDLGAIAQLMDQVRQGTQEIQILQQQVQQVMTLYNAVAHVTDLGSAVGVLGLLGIQNPLPVNPYTVQSLLSGRGSIAGMSGTISGLFNTNFVASHVYTPTGDAYEAELMRRNATSIAGVQGLSDPMGSG
jgi:hypothetical protein